MTTEQFYKLNISDIVYVVINTGSYGIGKYQYIGIFKDHKDKPEEKHVFLSEHFLSTVTVLKDRVNNSMRLKEMFLTLNEAVSRQQELRKEERNVFDA